MGEGVQHHFAVSFTPEPVAGGLQLDSQFAKIVDLAVKAQYITVVSADHRLMASSRQVDNGQAPVTNAHIALNPVAFAIGAPVGDGIGHLLQNNRGHRGTV